jgi:hypothetical protein
MQAPSCITIHEWEVGSPHDPPKPEENNEKKESWGAGTELMLVKLCRGIKDWRHDVMPQRRNVVVIYLPSQKVYRVMARYVD